jgi:F-type H+-transporting ATPase subunit delta
MSRAIDLGRRYAKALYELALDNRRTEKVLNDLRVLVEALEADASIQGFISNPQTSPIEVETVFRNTLQGLSVAPELRDAVLLMARRRRLAILRSVLEAFEAECDSANGVTRGSVRSATELSSAERTRIEQTVEKALKKKVILTYRIDPTVLGGLVAQVGSHNFDDTISSHLRRMNEDLKRSIV